MDTDTGKIYHDVESAKFDLRLKGVPEEEIDSRLIQAARPVLRKLRKMILAQQKREYQRKPAPGAEGKEGKK